MVDILCLPFHNLYLLIRQPVEPVDHGIDQLIRLFDPLPQGAELAHGPLELRPQHFPRLSAGGVNCQLLLVLLEDRQQALIITLIVAQNLRLGLEVLDLRPQIALQPLILR